MAWQRERNSFRLGLAGKLLLGTILPVMLLLILLATVLLTNITSIVTKVKNDNIGDQVSAAAKEVHEYFEQYFLMAGFIQDYPSLQGLFQEVEAAPPEFRLEESSFFEAVRQDLKRAHQRNDSAIYAVWVAAFRNSQLMQSDDYVSDESYHVEERVWYQTLQKHPGEHVLTPAYVDISSGRTIVSVIRPITDRFNQTIGVVGIDISTEELSEYLNSISLGVKGYITVYDSADNIISHPNPNLVGKNLQEISYSKNIEVALQQRETTDIIKYEREQNKYFGKTAYLSEFDWMVLGCIPAGEYFQELRLIAYIIIGGFLVCSILSVVICLARARSIVRPIQQLGLAAQEFAKGNLNVKLQSGAQDEVGDLTEVFIQTQHSLKEMISDVSRILRALSNKNLTVQTGATYQGDFSEMEESLQHITQRMNMVMLTIVDTANQVDSGASQVSHGAQVMAQGATEQASSIEQLAASINEISLQMQDMADNAQAASDQARIMGNEMYQSSDKMKELMAAMDSIVSAAGEIEKIIKVIEDIAFQTNILALNAAVEAARAGQAGKGFAVVADEVRDLASKSAEASQNTAMLIENSLVAVRNGTKLAQETSGALLAAVTGVEAVSTDIGFISEKLLQQSESIQTITSTVDQISSVVHTNSATAEESAAASQELSAQATMLQQLMEEFRLQRRFGGASS